MPVSADRFDRGEEHYPIESEIVRPLQENPGTAYTLRSEHRRGHGSDRSESNVEPADFDEFVVRVLDDGEGERSYYAAP